jgi:ketosteroid isomerase-like protein
MVIHRLLFLGTLSLTLSIPTPMRAQALPGAVATRRAITQVLATQTAAWNKGDIPGFMASYWHSDSLVFIGKKGLTYGWQPTLANYRKSYPDAAQMGQLDFGNLHITPLAAEVAQVIGRWHLARPGAAAGDLQGHFLLIFRRIGGQWVIVADHSS